MDRISISGSDWYSPTRLLTSPVHYDIPGDRFIPNRSLMDLDKVHCFLTSKTQKPRHHNLMNDYRQKMEENLKLDRDGKPFRMLVFRGSPKSSRKSIRFIDDLRYSDEETFNHTSKQPRQQLFKRETKALDAPMLADDYYLNIMDWGKNNILAIALGSELYVWNAENGKVEMLFRITRDDDYLTCVSWSQDSKTIAAGHMCSQIQLWDVETCKLVRTLEGHQDRVGTAAWNGHILTSGSSDKSIINHDVRARDAVTSHIHAHRKEVCGLKWSSRGNILASGGDDNNVYIWEASRMSSSKDYLYRLDSHCAAVKALAWCPYESHILASGGGKLDGSIKFWNIQKGICIKSIYTNSQISGLEWNRHHKEILSSHGFGRDTDYQNQLCLWRYPSMSRVGGSARQISRVLQLSQSPDGLTVVSAGADEALRFWDIFGPPKADEMKDSGLDSMLSLKTSLIR